MPHPNGGSRNNDAGSERLPNRADTKAEAYRLGGELARKDNVEHVVLKKEGTIG